jgi:hypothetical protein
MSHHRSRTASFHKPASSRKTDVIPQDQRHPCKTKRHPGNGRDPGPYRLGTPVIAGNHNVIPAKAGIQLSRRHRFDDSERVLRR